MLKIGPNSESNIVDYAAEEKEAFQSKAFTAVDSLILSKLSYLHFNGIVPDSVRGTPVTIEEIFRGGMPESLFREARDGGNSRRLFTALAQSPRFCKTA